MTAEHVVVPVEPCGAHDNGLYDGPPCVALSTKTGIPTRGRCEGCIGDGRRALLDQAVPVERGGSTVHYADGTTKWAWSEVES